MNRIALWSFATSVLLGQSQAVIRIDVNLVQVDAVVTDSKNKHVGNLKAEDFEILQDGKPQKITNFSYITSDVPAPAANPAGTGSTTAKRTIVPPPPLPPVALIPADVHRTMALVVDDLALSSDSMAHVREALRKFVNREMQPGDLVAILRTSAGMGVLQQFTTDRTLLNAAIDHVKFTLGRVGVNSFDPVEVPAGPHPADPVIDQLRSETFMVGTLGALRYVVDGLHDMPGRKSVVLFSENLTMSPNALLDPYADGLRQLIERANRASVVIYTIDPRGLQSFFPTAADSSGRGGAAAVIAVMAARSAQMFDSQQGLAELASETGGLFIKNDNFVDDALRDVIGDTEGYYLIGYHPDAATFDSKTGKPQYHKVRVRLKASGFHVRSRNGFFGESDTRFDTQNRQAPLTGSAALAHALTSPFSSSDIRVRLTTLFNQTPDARSCLSALLHIDARDLSFVAQPDGSQQAFFEVVAMTFVVNGQRADQSDRAFGLNLKPEQYAAVLKSGLVYVVNQPVQHPGQYQMRVALLDQNSNRLGSANEFVTVPDLNNGRLTLSSILLRGDAREARTGADHAEGQVVDDDPATAAALRVFKPGDELYYQYLVFNAQSGAARKADLEVQTRLFRDGKQVYTGQPMVPEMSGEASTHRLLAGGHMTLAKTAAPGDYVLQLIVTGKLAKQKAKVASQWIDFEVLR